MHARMPLGRRGCGALPGTAAVAGTAALLGRRAAAAPPPWKARVRGRHQGSIGYKPIYMRSDTGHGPVGHKRKNQKLPVILPRCPHACFYFITFARQLAF